MTIDERLERLTERHESLTHAVELLAYSHRDNEALLARVIGLVENVTRLVHSHERRISDLEGGRA